MKKILNFKKWVGPVFGILAFLFMVLTVTQNSPFYMITNWVIIPIFAYGFTLLYSSTKSHGPFNVVMTIMLFVFVISLGMSGVNSSFGVNHQVFYQISRIAAAFLPAASMLYGIEQLMVNQEDNFYEINFQNQI